MWTSLSAHGKSVAGYDAKFAKRLCPAHSFVSAVGRWRLVRYELRLSVRNLCALNAGRCMPYASGYTVRNRGKERLLVGRLLNGRSSLGSYYSRRSAFRNLTAGSLAAATGWEAAGPG